MILGICICIDRSCMEVDTGPCKHIGIILYGYGHKLNKLLKVSCPQLLRCILSTEVVIECLSKINLCHSSLKGRQIITHSKGITDTGKKNSPVPCLFLKLKIIIKLSSHAIPKGKPFGLIPYADLDLIDWPGNAILPCNALIAHIHFEGVHIVLFEHGSDRLIGNAIVVLPIVETFCKGCIQICIIPSGRKCEIGINRYLPPSVGKDIIIDGIDKPELSLIRSYSDPKPVKHDGNSIKDLICLILCYKCTGIDKSSGIDNLLNVLAGQFLNDKIHKGITVFTFKLCHKLKPPLLY